MSSTKYTHVHADEIYLMLSYEDEDGFLNQINLGSIDKFNTSSNFKTEPYYAIGDDINPSDYYKQSFVSRGTISSFVIKNCKVNNRYIVDILLDLVKGTKDYNNYDFTYYDIQIYEYNLSTGKGYRYNIILDDLNVVHAEGEYAKLDFSFYIRSVEGVSLY